MVHNDMIPSSVVVMAGGKPKLHDFNLAEFLWYNANTNQACSFASIYHGPWWQVPEQVVVESTNLLDKKVDIYVHGNLLYHVMTTTLLRGQMAEENIPQGHR